MRMSGNLQPQGRQHQIAEIVSNMKFALAIALRSSGSPLAEDAASASDDTLRQLAEKSLDTEHGTDQ